MANLAKKFRLQSTSARRRQQAASPLARVMAALSALFMAGCGPKIAVGTPVSWWHNLEGGKIAEDRPPPPDAKAPWPTIATVPAKPNPGPAAYRDAVTTKLAAERDLAERHAADAPLTPPVIPALPNPQPQPAGAASAALEAATPAPKPATNTDLVPEPASPTLSDLPDLKGPPAPPGFMEIAKIPAPSRSVTATPAAPPGTEILFTASDAILQQNQMPTLQDAATRRGTGRIRITGLGDAVSDTPEGQSKALQLALTRAQTIADALVKIGVPREKLTLAAYAFGRGARLTMLP
jgi:outer membrane protein OmpA-like peptidoglycan-associated protein